MKNNTVNKNYRLCLAIVCMMFTQLSFAGFAVIVNPSAAVSSASPSDIRAVFLHKSKKISGVAVVPIDNADNAMRKTFLKSVVRKKPRAFKSYWTRLVFSGKASPLKSQSNDNGVKQWVGSHADAIGFIDSKNVDDSVKVIYQAD